jgi:hypothetical protein
MLDKTAQIGGGGKEYLGKREIFEHEKKTF